MVMKKPEATVDAEALLRAHLLRQIGPAVFPQQSGDLPVTFEMEGRKFHKRISRGRPRSRGGDTAGLRLKPEQR